MKIYEDRKMNAMYLIHNLNKVSNLKEGMEILISTEDVGYFTNKFVKNKFSENYDIDRLVPLIKSIEDNIFNTPIDWIEHISRLENIIGNSKLDFKIINNVKCLILTLSTYMVNNLKEMYHEDDYIVFTNLTITSRCLEDIEVINKTIGIGTLKVKIHTEDEIVEFKNKVIEKILEKDDIVNRLLSGEELPDENGKIWSKNGYEEHLKIISYLADQLKNSDDKLLIINIFFCSLSKTPMTLFKLLGINLDNNDVGIITKIFS